MLFVAASKEGKWVSQVQEQGNLLALPIYPLVPSEFGAAEMYNPSKNFNFFKPNPFTFCHLSYFSS